MTEQELQKIEEAIRNEHHSEQRWTHDICTKLIAEVRYLREHLDNAEHDRDRAKEKAAE